MTNISVEFREKLFLLFDEYVFLRIIKYLIIKNLGMLNSEIYFCDKQRLLLNVRMYEER